jgi:dTDP-glucose pyrophosphorylase
MLNVLLPIAGTSTLFDARQYPYPVPLIEVLGKPIIQHVVENLREIDAHLNFTFVVRAEDCRRFHIDQTLALLTANHGVVVQLAGETRGALCSALMAIEHIAEDQPLIVANSDQLFAGVLRERFALLAAAGVDAGCLCFESVHPRWSYVRTEGDAVCEAAEKRPISRRAIAGFYYFAQGGEFVTSAMRTILNRRAVDERYFVAPVFNEYILAGKNVRAVDVPDDAYVSFYTPHRIERFERRARQNERR